MPDLRIDQAAAQRLVNLLARERTEMVEKLGHLDTLIESLTSAPLVDLAQAPPALALGKATARKRRGDS